MSFVRKEHKSIGTAKIKDIEALGAWLKTDDGKYYIENRWSEHLNKKHANNWKELFPDSEAKCFYNMQNKIPGFSEAQDLYDSSWGWSRFKDLKEVHEFYEALDQSFSLLYIGDGYAVICDNKRPYLIPLEFLSVAEFKSYDDLPVSALKALGATEGTSLIPAGTEDISVSGVKDRMKAKEDEIEDAKNQIKELEKEKQEKLEQLKQELEAAYKDKFALIEQKKRELQAMKEDLENQLFMLDTEIYGIRCYHGEAVKFSKLSDGKTSPVEEAIVVHQKIRYLDEEMGKMLSIYGFDGSNEDLKYFERALVAREDILDTFLPQKKCISFVKVSKSGLIRLPSETVANMLDTYEKFHGKTIGILIRNNEQVFVGWADEERISLFDENVFYNKKTSVEQEEDFDKVRSSSKEEVVSRYFIFAILQGILDDGKMISIPEKVSFLAPNPYIFFSMADAWLEDNRFGSFSDIVDRTQLQFMVGDMVLTTMHITRDDRYERDFSGQSTRYKAWNNDRGRGEKNRTHDASLADCTVYPLNLIDRTDIYRVYYLEYPYSFTVKETVLSETETSRRTTTSTTPGEQLQGPPVLDHQDIEIENYEKCSINIRGLTPYEVYKSLSHLIERWYDIGEIKVNYRSHWGDAKSEGKAYLRSFYKCELVGTDFDYFLSAEKDPNWETGKSAKANLQIYPNEVLNLTFLNSVWLRYAINNKKLGSFKLGNNQVDYAQAVRYLNKALFYLDEREKEEAALLSPYMELYDEWQVDLSEWKIKNNIHRLTDTRAKRFAKERAGK